MRSIKFSVVCDCFFNSLYDMQHIFTCIMLCCLAFECVGIHIIQAVNLYNIKCEMQELAKVAVSCRDSNRKTEILRFSDDDYTLIEWHDGGKEFRLNGIMYDVVRQWRDGDAMAIVCFRDDKETEVLGNIAGKKEKQSNAARSNNNDLFSTKTFAKYLQPGSNREITKSPIYIFYISYLFPEIKPASQEIPTPPPRFV